MKTIAFLPIKSDNAYITKTINILKEKYEVINYEKVKSGKIPIEKTDYLYLNWIENTLYYKDKEIIEKAKAKGKKVFWVFHNKLSYDKEFYSQTHTNIKYLIDISDGIIIHSKESKDVLLRYNESIDEKKIHFIPHLNYCGAYDFLGLDLRKKYDVKENETLFGLFGLIRPYKNIELLIDLFSSDEKLKNSKLLILGKSNDAEYYKSLKDRIPENSNIILRDLFIHDLAMGSYLSAIDVMVLPYDITSSMNSGAMIMSFSYGKTVIIPEIAMSKEYSSSLIYKYTYDEEEKHMNALREQVHKAFEAGREGNRKKGEKLKEIVVSENNNDVVGKYLFELLG